MTYYKLSFKVQHECPHTRFTRDLPSSMISHWCNWSRDVIEIRFSYRHSSEIDQKVKGLLADLDSTVIRQTSEVSNTQFILQHCSCDKLPPPTLQSIERHECLELQPKIYVNGWEYYHVISFTSQDLNSPVKELQNTSNVEIISKTTVSENAIHDAMLVPTSSIIGGLTEKQAWSLLTAFENGYYEIPRRSTAEQISLRTNITRTNYTDHLRKAELKIMSSIVPYLKMKSPEFRAEQDSVA